MPISSVGVGHNELTRQEGVEVDLHPSQILFASLHFNSHMQLSLHQLTPLQNAPLGDLHQWLQLAIRTTTFKKEPPPQNNPNFIIALERF